MSKLSRASLAEVIRLRGASPMALSGKADGQAPAGLFHRGDAIEAVPGTDRTVDGQPLADIWTELLARNAAFNTVADRLVSLLTYEVDRSAEKVAVPSNPGFQEATEFGRPSQIAIQYVTRGFPLKHYDLGYGFTQEFIDRARGNEILSVQSEVQYAYERLVFTKVMAALFNDTNATDQDGVAVKRLYNNDGEIPPRWQRWVHDGTHTHYLTSAGATFAEADLGTMDEHLTHHGYAGKFFLQAHRDDLYGTGGITGFASFVPAASAQRPQIVSGPIVGELGAGLDGLPIVGYHGKWIIMENNEIPSGYWLGMISPGVNSTRNTVALRVHENPSARGLRLVEGPNGRYPLIDAVYDTYVGAGVAHRGAAVVMQETAGAYSVPTFN